MQKYKRAKLGALPGHENGDEQQGKEAQWV